jgi:hypothetical protein
VTGGMLREVEVTVALPRVRPWQHPRINPISQPMRT